MINVKKSLTFFVLFISSLAHSQSGSLSGIILDSETKDPVFAVGVELKKMPDSVLVSGMFTSFNGRFEFSNLSAGEYFMVIRQASYLEHTTTVILEPNDSIVLEVLLAKDFEKLRDLVIEGVMTPMQIKGDTVEFNSDAFKVHPNATAEDLVQKMPGVTKDGNNVQFGGEQVQKVLVDGRPFFSDDPTTALRNLPASVVQSVQVYDQSSDQSQFSGFSDGNEQKTINLTTRRGMNVGNFGNVNLGYGSDGRYSGGLTFNQFNGPRRISIIGLSNNINEQNFSFTDILQVMSNTSNSQGPGQGSAISNFMTSTQNGITNTNAIGLNYLDNWGKKIQVSGNYFFNRGVNFDTSSINRTYFTQETLKYLESSSTVATNVNHRLSFKMEYKIDSLNKLTVEPRLVYQAYNLNRFQDGKTSNELSILNLVQNNSNSDQKSISLNNDVLFQHRFKRNAGRTLSANLNIQYNPKIGDGRYYSYNESIDTTLTSHPVDQEYQSDGFQKSAGLTINFTEPIGETDQLLVRYAPTYAVNESEKRYLNIDLNEEYTLLDSSLSNTFNSNYLVQNGGISYRHKGAKSILIGGIDFQYSELNVKQSFPLNYSSKSNFSTILPSFRYDRTFDQNTRLRISLETFVNAPSISELQNNIDQSNSLFVSSGNPDLKQSYTSKISIRLMKRQVKKEQHMMIFVRGTHAQNYISNSTEIIGSDTTIRNVFVSKGSQYLSKVNLNGFWNINGFGVYGLPVTKIKSNLNLHVGIGAKNTPTLINNQINEALNSSIRSGFYLGSNISEYVDFSLGYNANLNHVSNSLQSQNNNINVIHDINFKINVLFQNFTLNSEITHHRLTGMTSGYNQIYTLWNASLGYKFLSNKSLEFKVKIFDILEQNNSIYRNITETYFEDVETQVVGRYIMASLSYTFKKFKDGAVGPSEMKFPKNLPPPGNLPFKPN